MGSRAGHGHASCAAGVIRRCGVHPPPVVEKARSVGGACQQAHAQSTAAARRLPLVGSRAHPGVARGARGLQNQPRVDRVRPQRAQRRDQPPAGRAARGDLAGAPPANSKRVSCRPAQARRASSAGLPPAEGCAARACGGTRERAERLSNTWEPRRGGAGSVPAHAACITTQAFLTERWALRRCAPHTRMAGRGACQAVLMAQHA